MQPDESVLGTLDVTGRWGHGLKTRVFSPPVPSWRARKCGVPEWRPQWRPPECNMDSLELGLKTNPELALDS